MTYVAYLLARFVKKLRRKRPCAHARAVSLEYTVDIADLVGSNAKAGACSGSGGVRRRHKRVAAEIHVEHRALSALTQHLLPFVDKIVHQKLAVDDLISLKILHRIEPFGFKSGQCRSVPSHHLELLEMAVTCGGIFLLEILLRVTEAQSVAACLVSVCRADTLTRSADFAFTLGILVGGIEHAVCGHDQVSLARQPQHLAQIHPALGKLLSLISEEDRIEHHSVAYYIDLAMLKHTRGDRAEHILLPVKFERMSGVGATLKARYRVITGGEHVHHLTFSLVAPLKAEQNIDFHYFLLDFVSILRLHDMHTPYMFTEHDVG